MDVSNIHIDESETINLKVSLNKFVISIVSAIKEVNGPIELGLESKTFTRESIFMNIFNCHVNRSPLSGKIEDILSNLITVYTSKQRKNEIKNVVKENNVMVLTFNKYGILESKNFYDKEKIAKIKFTEKITENNLSQKSFVQQFLQSIKTKMYGNN